MKLTWADVLTPANLMTLSGLALSIAGAVRIDTTAGVLLFASGRVLDVFDGIVARRTHSSNLGAMFDVLADKIAVFTVIVFAWSYAVVPRGVLLFFLLQAGINVMLGTYSQLHHLEPHTSKNGKHASFGLVGSTVAFALGTTTGVTAWSYLGGLVFLVSAPLAVVATFGYWHAARAKG